MAVCILVLLRYKADYILQHSLGCRLCNLLHRHKPLHRQLRLDSYACTLRVAHIVGVSLGLFEQLCCLQILLNLLAALEAVYAHIHTNLIVDCAVVVEDVDSFEAILLAEHIIINIVCWGNLQGTCSELDINILVTDNRN